MVSLAMAPQHWCLQTYRLPQAQLLQVLPADAAPPLPAAGLIPRSAMWPFTKRTAFCRFGSIGLGTIIVGKEAM